MTLHGALKPKFGEKDVKKWSDFLRANPKSGSEKNIKIYKSMMTKLRGKRLPECSSEIVYKMKEAIVGYSDLSATDKKWWDSLFRKIKNELW